MSRSNTTLEVVIDPVRARHLKTFEAELIASKAMGQVCQIEVLRRDEAGAVIRDGVLNLPSRSDFACTSGKNRTFRDLQIAQNMHFDPVDLNVNEKLELTVFPFSWDQVQISFDTGDDPKRLLRLRLWYLEWLQERKPLRDDGVKGVVHSLRGPKHDGNIWHLCIDMGSAPTEALTELLTVLASRGVSRVTLGAELNRVAEHGI